MSSYRVIITGVDPHCKKGGISFAMSGYISALKNENIIYKLIPTYRPNSFLSKHFLFLAMLPKLMYFIFRMKMKNIPCIVYSHSGAGVSFFREGVIAIFARLLGA
ncbi:MAG: hypothetical protein KAI02_02705, partial [Gammaproteobacteria bacterium]|nr:hypothetical protein [Gammaproteobacteria bacterium]